MGDAQVAYQVVGDGPIDLVFVQGMASNVELQWDVPTMTPLLKRLASFSRLITFDRRGCGVSDPVRFEAMPTWESWTEDMGAVLDAAGSEGTAIIAHSDGCLWGQLFAATNPGRVTALTLWNPWARTRVADDYPVGQSDDVGQAIQDMVSKMWGTEELAQMLAPRYETDLEAASALARFMRAACTPAAADTQQRFIAQADVRHALPSIQCPTLVLYRDNAIILHEWVRYVADHIDGATFVEVPGSGFGLDCDVPGDTLDLIEEFLTGERPIHQPDRALATVLFTDIVGSTELAAELGDKRWGQVLDTHDQVARTTVEKHSGRIVDTDGDGLLAAFDLPGRAIRCALEFARELLGLGIVIRAGAHTGEVDLRREGQVGGIAVHIGARVMAAADGGQLLCTSTVKDLTAGSGFTFDDAGAHSLKGVPGEWRLFSVREM